MLKRIKNAIDAKIAAAKVAAEQRNQEREELNYLRNRITHHIGDIEIEIRDIVSLASSDNYGLILFLESGIKSLAELVSELNDASHDKIVFQLGQNSFRRKLIPLFTLFPWIMINEISYLTLPDSDRVNRITEEDMSILLYILEKAGVSTEFELDIEKNYLTLPELQQILVACEAIEVEMKAKQELVPGKTRVTELNPTELVTVVSLVHQALVNIVEIIDEQGDLAYAALDNAVTIGRLSRIFKQLFTLIDSRHKFPEFHELEVGPVVINITKPANHKQEKVTVSIGRLIEVLENFLLVNDKSKREA